MTQPATTFFCLVCCETHGPERDAMVCLAIHDSNEAPDRICDQCNEPIGPDDCPLQIDSEPAWYCCDGCRDATLEDMDYARRCDEEARRDFGDDWLIDGVGFAYPGGESALRAATPDNPRNLPCPTCGEPNRLTPLDRAAHYQCDQCATRND